jgi:hypothetical protein
MMFILPIVFAVIVTWNAAAADWIVAFATGFTQLGIWLTIAGLLPVPVLWSTLKSASSVIPSNQNRARWSLNLKA